MDIATELTNVFSISSRKGGQNCLLFFKMGNSIEFQLFFLVFVLFFFNCLILTPFAKK